MIRMHSVGLACGMSLLVTGIVAHADSWPHRKPGLWELTIALQKSPMPPMASKYCIDRATEDALMSAGQDTMRQSCPKHDVHVSGNTGTIDSVCKFGKYTQTAHTTVTFTGDSSYRSEVHSHMEPALSHGGERVSTITAQWKGPCPADMKPGDMVVANGMRMHVGSAGH